MKRALHSCFHHFASNFVRFIYIAVKMDIICRATAAAMIFRKAVFTLFFGIKICVSEYRADIFVKFSVEHVAHLIFGVGRELVARENIALRNAAPGPSDYFVDEGLLQKCVRCFEAPDAEEARDWHVIR